MRMRSIGVIEIERQQRLNDPLDSTEVGPWIRWVNGEDRKVGHISQDPGPGWTIDMQYRHRKNAMESL